jgi:predicted polyphosphate/ATP-dependent NAD kinase
VNICHSIGSASTPVLGIPSGVKMHSAVFAVHPSAGGDVALMYLTGRTRGVREAEASLEGIAHDATDGMRDDCRYDIGPGTTTRTIMVKLGLEQTLFGVDVAWRRRLIGKDVNDQ